MARQRPLKRASKPAAGPGRAATLGRTSQPGVTAGLRPVFLLTDFGLQDSYVGALKAVIRTLQPGLLSIDDLTHAVPPQDLAAAAFQLFTVLAYLPDNALTVAVVDPGVGTGRAICVSQWGNRLFIAPDNGLLGAAFGWLAALHGVADTWATRREARVGGPTVTALLTDDGAHPLPAARPISPWGRTFDGRDRFAPLAARLADPVAGAALLERFEPWRTVPVAALPGQGPEGQADRSWLGRLISFDHFGNGITNLSLRNWLPATPFMTGKLGGGGLLGVAASQPAWQVRFAGRVIPWVRSYAAAEDLPPSLQSPDGGPTWVALVNSSDLIELAVPGGSFQASAAEALAKPGGLNLCLEPALKPQEADVHDH